MDRHSMTDRIIADDIRIIEQEKKEGSAEHLYAILCMFYDDLALREFIDVYNSRTWED